MNLRSKRKGFPLSVRKLVAERSGGVCEKCGNQRATHHHHRRLRHRWGPGATHGAANDLHICTSCHDWIHHNPKRSETSGVGWMLPSGRDPQQSVVLYRGETSILGDDGRRWLVVNYELEAA